MKLIEESKTYTIVVSEKEYIFIKWCLDSNKDDIVSKPTKLKLRGKPKKAKADEMPF